MMTPSMMIAEAIRKISASCSDNSSQARITPDSGCRNWSRPTRVIPPLPSAQYHRI
jgi:hypothetical protein